MYFGAQNYVLAILHPPQAEDHFTTAPYLLPMYFYQTLLIKAN